MVEINDSVKCPECKKAMQEVADFDGKFFKCQNCGAMVQLAEQGEVIKVWKRIDDPKTD